MVRRSASPPSPLTHRRGALILPVACVRITVAANHGIATVDLAHDPGEGDVDGIPAIRPDRSARIRHRVRLLGNQRHLWPDRRGALHPRGPSRDRQRHQLFRHRRSLRHGRLGARTGQGAWRAAEGRHGRHQRRRRLSGRAQPPRQYAPALDGRPRQQPAQSRHRSCRCLSGALAGHQHAVRGNHADPRRRRPSGQGTLCRRVEFPPVAAGSLHEAAAHRRRAVWLEHVRPPDASGDLPVVPGQQCRA